MIPGLRNSLHPCIRDARKWRENDEMKEIHTLHFLILSLCPPFLSISYIFTFPVHVFTVLLNYINTESNLLTISHISDDFTCVLAAPCRADRPHWAPSELSATALCYCALLVSPPPSPARPRVKMQQRPRFISQLVLCLFQMDFTTKRRSSHMK